MKNKSKKIISLFIIIVAIIVSFKIVKNKETNAEIKIETRKSDNLENIKFKPQLNLTQEFLKKNMFKITEKMNIDNTNKLTYNDIYSNIEKLIELEDKENELTKNDIKTFQKSDKENEFLYIYLIQQIVKTKMAEINQLNPNNFNNLEKYFEKIYYNLNETTEILKNMNVPPYFIEDHLALLNFFNKHKNIYKSFSSPKEDPLRYLINSYKIIDLPDPLKEYQQIIEKMIEKLEKKYAN